jgi:sigma-B regulation protein RsbU (phosphoserine phosphatase)
MKEEELQARIRELESKVLDLEDALARQESQCAILENFCFGLEREYEKIAKRAESVSELEAQVLDLEDQMKKLESQNEILENFCFGLERDHERARKVIEERDALIFAELEHARRFQQATLTGVPLIEGHDLDVVYKPAAQVGGDLYDVTQNVGGVRLFMADATGHGIKAALSTMLIKAEYEAVRDRNCSPGRLLKLLNDKVAASYRSLEMIFTALVVDFDLSSGRVLYACAAHPAPMALHEGRAMELPDAAGSFVGLTLDTEFEDKHAFIEPGGALLLASDGVTEAIHPTRGEFGEARVLSAMETAQGALAGAVWSALDAFLFPKSPEDDVTLLGLRRR